MTRIIALAADHGGFLLKVELASWLLSSPVNGFSVNQPSQVYNQVTDCPLGVWCDAASISSALPFPRDPIPNMGICRPGEWC